MVAKGATLVTPNATVLLVPPASSLSISVHIARLFSIGWRYFVQSWHPTLVYSPATRSLVCLGATWGGPGKSGQADEIESDAPLRSSTRYGVQATIAIVFSDCVQTFEPRELATGGSGSRFAVCAENAYAAHAGPHDYTGAVLRVAVTPMKHSRHRGSRMRPSTQSRDDRNKSRALRTSRNPGDPPEQRTRRPWSRTWNQRGRCRAATQDGGAGNSESRREAPPRAVLSESGPRDRRSGSREGRAEPGRGADYCRGPADLQHLERHGHLVLERPFLCEERPGELGIADRIEDLRKTGDDLARSEDLRGRDGQSTPGRFPAEQRALADPVIDRGTRHPEPRGGCGDAEHVAVPMTAYDERRERLRRFLRPRLRIALRGGRLKGGRYREARFAGTVAQEVPRARRECREPVCENAHDLGRRSFYPCHAAHSPVQCWTTLPSSCSVCEVHARCRCYPPFYFRDKVGVHACRNE